MDVLQFLTVFGIAIGLSMDAFAVAITQGACLSVETPRYPLSIGLTFGAFQAVMPLIGYQAGALFCQKAQLIDHWVALIILSVVGIKMGLDGINTLQKKKNAGPASVVCTVQANGKLYFHNLLLLGVATSIDALAVGLTFGMLSVNLWWSVSIIGITTFMLSTSGVYIGKRAGPFLGEWMEIAGSLMLLTIGISIVVDHLSKGI